MLSNIPISAIRAFEAAARTGSFRDAANELHLTPSAVSHAIRKLEGTLRTVLFERSARSVRLTPAGENLMRHTGAAFDQLRRGLEEVAARGPQLVRVHSAPSFAAQWLAILLGFRHEGHQIVASVNQVALPAAPYDSVTQPIEKAVAGIALF